MASQCSLAIIDLKSGNIVHALHIDGVIQELFDVVVPPNAASLELWISRMTILTV